MTRNVLIQYGLNLRGISPLYRCDRLYSELLSDSLNVNITLKVILLSRKVAAGARYKCLMVVSNLARGGEDPILRLDTM